MKRLVLLLLAAWFIPQVALAAWWNPLSWSIFHRTDSNKVEVLENRVKELETKLNATSSPASSSSTQTPQIKKTTTAPNTSSVQINSSVSSVTTQVPLETFLGILQKYKDLQTIVATEKNSVKAHSELATERNYYKFLDNLQVSLSADAGYLTQIKYVEPKPANIVQMYVSKYTQLLSDYHSEQNNYISNRPNDEMVNAKAKVVSYISDNKYLLYLPANHVTAAEFLYLFDKLFKTDYAKDFETKTTQQETVEFANRFLIDQQY